ncbi:beta-lactamase-like protein [Chytridium lagenaria]|nr:beta-lactamase-like protein [Chytridium lagenaria]
MSPKRMLEWMGEGISSLIAQDRKAPFDFQHVNLLHKLKELEKFRGPKVVIATLPSLDCGFARELFLTWSSSQENTIILPDRGPPGSMARRLFDEWGSFQRQDALANVSIDIPLELSRSVELEGEELAEYVAKEAARKEKEAAEEALRTRNMMEDDESDLSEEEEDVELQGKTSSNQFDVYVKDTVRSTGYFKQAQSFKMFPCVEPRRRVDDYGEVIDPTLFSAGELPDADDPSEAIPMPQAVSPATKIEAGPPSKYITESVVVNVRCRVIYIDFEGRIDGRSTKEILSQLAPRKLKRLKAWNHLCLEHNALTNDVFCPKKDEWINVSIATNVYQIKLTDSLVTSLNMEKVDDYEIAYISGFIKMADTAPAVLKENEDNDMDMDKKPSSVSSNIPTLDLLPMEYHLSRVPVIVGDVRLSEFRRAVVDQGFDAEFVAGTLLVNKSVVVRRGQGGRLMLEGPMGSDYFRLRTLLYAEHAVVY